MTIGAHMVGGNPLRTGGREEGDFYATPSEVTLALLAVEPEWPEPIGEPFCGNGAISAVLQAQGRSVISSDLVYRGRLPEWDGLASYVDYREAKGFESVISNPPFNILPEITLHYSRNRPSKLALLHPINFWCAAGAGDGRDEVWNTFPPARRYDLTWRVDFMGLGRPTMNLAWSVWDETHKGPCEYHRLKRSSVVGCWMCGESSGILGKKCKACGTKQ